jgi:hypothetical protein
MADTIFSNWLTALQNLQSSVSKDLSEIRKQKAEIQQLKADILNEVARGKFIRDDERIVLSAPEIVIGNVDASGMLYGDSGTIIIRGQKLGLQGVGEHGSVETRAALISQTAVDPGPDGIEEVVRPQSAVITQAKHITLQSNEAEDDGYFSRSATTTGATGVRIHADEEVEIDASQSVEHRKEAIENRLNEVKQQAFDLSSEGLTTMAKITGTVAAMEVMLQGQDLINFDEYLMRVTVTILDDLTQVFNSQMPMAYDALENAISLMSRLAEVNRRQKALEAEKKLVEDATEHFQEMETGAHLTVTAEQMSIASKDGDNNIRENPAASISVQTGRLNITSYKKDGSLIDDSYVRIASHDVEISTVNPQLKEEGKLDGDYVTDGSVQINSKNVSVTAVDYSISDDNYEEKEQTKGSSFSVRTENISMLSYDTEGNSTGTWYVSAENMGQGSFDKDGNATGTLNLSAEQMQLAALDKDAKASGQIMVNAKDVFVKSVDIDGSSGSDKGLAEGGNMVILAEKMFVGRTDDKTLTKELQISAEKAGVYAKETAEIQQDGGKAMVQLDGGNVAVKGSKAEFFGDNTVNGKTEFKADVKAPKLVADSLEAKSSFKSSNISDGFSTPSSPSSAQLNAKLKENDAPKQK